MKNRWYRLLSVLLCVQLILSCAPVFSEEETAASVGILDLSEVMEVAEETAETFAAESGSEQQAPEAVSAEEVAEAEVVEEAPVEETSAEDAAAAEDVAAPTAEPTAEPTAAPTAEPTPEASIVPSAVPTAEASIEPTLDPEAAAAAPAAVEDLVAATEIWITELEEKNYSTEYDKALWLYRRMISKISADESKNAAQTAEAALIDGKAGSLGFARAFEALLDACNIASDIIYAYGDEDTAWNVVRLDKRWTHIDAFSDARDGSSGKRFGLTDNAMARYHSWDYTSYICSSPDVNYYVNERNYIACGEIETLFESLYAAVQDQAAQLRFYWYAGEEEVNYAFATRLISSIASDVAISGEEDKCYCVITLDYDPADVTPAPTATAAPTVTAAPTATVAPTVTPAPTVKPGTEPEEIVPAASEIIIGVGEKRSVADWTLLPEGTKAEVSYTSSEEKYAEVDEDGMVTGKKAGESVITIRTENGLRCRIAVTVKKAPSKIASFVAERTTIAVDESVATSFRFNSNAGGGVSYSSNDEIVATVDENGVITGHAPGKAEITITSYNGHSKSGVITVIAAPSEIILNQSQVMIGEEDKWQLRYSFNEGADGSVSFASSDKSVASVNSKGVISALKAGTAVITVTAYNGVSAECSVTVTEAPHSITLEAERHIIGLGEKLQLQANILPEGTLGTVEYDVSSSRATVDEDGLLTAKRTGTVTVTASTYNGKEAELKLTIKKAPSSISLAAERSEIAVGESVQLDVALSSGSAGSYTLSSSDESKLSIDENGLATALSGGKVKVTAESYNGRSKTITIDIIAEPEYIELSQSTIALGVSDSYRLDYAMNEGAGGSVSFRSSDNGIAAVSAEGVITAVKKGSAVITATAYNGVSAQCIVNVISAPSGVEFVVGRTELGVDERIRLEAAMLPAGTVGNLKFSSDNSKVLSVSEDGIAEARRTGSAVVTVETYNGKTARLQITVKSEPDSIGFVSDHESMGVGETAHLTAVLPANSAGACSYTSSDEDILSIDADGNATALAAGEVRVTVEAYNGVKRSRTITVYNAPEAVIPSHDNVSIGVQDSWKLECTLNEGAGGCIRFASSNEKVATVDANGVITALKEGYSIVTASAYNGVSAQCIVLVVPAPEGVSLSAPRTTLGVDETMSLVAASQPDGAVGMLEFASDNEKIITVDENGVVTAERTGTANVAVRTYNGKTASLKLTVKKAPRSISLSAARDEIGVGETLQLSAAIGSDYAGSYSFVSGDESVLTIDENGLATAHAPGKVSVTVVAYNGVKRSGSITVKAAPTVLLANPASIEVGLGDSVQMNVTMNANAAAAVVYSSADPSVASVEPTTGMITGKKVGYTRVTATTYNGISATALVYVFPQPTAITLPYDSLEIGVGDMVQLEPQVDEGCSTSFSYEASSSKYFNVDEYGVVEGLKVGSAKIAIRSSNGLELILNVRVRSAPTAVSLTPEDVTLGLGETARLSYSVPSTCAGSATFTIEDDDIATVDEYGVVTALKKGTTRIGVETYNGKRATGTLTVVSAPKSVSVSDVAIGVGQELVLSASFKPEDSHSELKCRLVSGDAVSVDENGVVTGVKTGTATLLVSTYVEGVEDTVKITVKSAPKSVSFPEEEYFVSVGETLRLVPTLSPDDSAAGLSWEVERAGFFTVDANGVVTPIMRGTTRVKVTTHNGHYAVATITVADPHFPEKLEFEDLPPSYLEVGESYTPVIGVYPESAEAALVWSTSDDDIVSINKKTGKITAVGHGAATIEAVSERNPALMLSYKIVVLSSERCLTMPTARTNTSKISNTLSQIKSVRSSAYHELETLYTLGEISKSEYNTRKSIISRAFDMYLFPWMTKELEPYWSKANSENGGKDYKPDIVYYGLPYTQTNRRHNVSSAVSGGYYYDSGKNYYLINNDKTSDRQYAGNDCSSFASMSVWGRGESHSYDSTRDIGTTSVYTTMKDWTELRPGDLLNKYNSHVVIFLYYANAAKTQMVIIEQGGGDGVTTNTVSCSIRKTSYYTEKGYSIKRLSSLV